MMEVECVLGDRRALVWLSLPVDPLEMKRVTAKAFGIADANDVVGFGLPEFEGDLLVTPAAFPAVAKWFTARGNPLRNVNVFVRMTSHERKHADLRQVEQSAPRRRNLLKFTLVGQQSVLLTSKDLEAVALLQKSTKLLEIDSGAMVAIFASFCDRRGMLEWEAFEEMVEEHLCPDGVGSPRENEFIREILGKTFFAFDPFGEQRIHARDLLLGMVLLSFDEDETKFRHLFQLFVTGRSKNLTFAQILRLLKCILTFSLAMNKGMVKLPSPYVYQLLDETSEAIARSIDIPEEDGIALEGFIEWFENEGAHMMPWMLLLLSSEDVIQALRWTLGTTDSGTPSIVDFLAETQSYQRELENSAKDDNEDLILFRFVFEPLMKTELTITSMDAETLDLILSTSEFSQRSPNEICRVFLQHAHPPELTVESYIKCIRALVPREHLDADEKRYLSLVLLTIFGAFDRDQLSKVSFEEFVSGFLVFARGPKSHKLALAFSLFDSDEDGRLSFVEFVRFFRSFLTLLFAIKKDAPELPANETYQTIDVTCVNLVDDLFKYHGIAEELSIGYTEFGIWYKDVGHQLVPWLELLDLEKWAMHEHSLEEEIEHRDEHDPRSPPKASAPVHSATRDISAEKPLLQVPLHLDGHVLEFFERDVSMLRDVLAASRFHERDAEAVHAELLGLCSGTGFTIDANSFNAWVDEQISAKSSFAIGIFSEVYNLFEIDGSGRAPVDELACAIGLLTKGNKSEKLALGFGLFDKDLDGALSKEELRRFLAALLLGLHTFTTYSETMSKMQILKRCTKAAEFAAGEICLENENLITFEDFATWYASKGGSQKISWVELFDLSKWPMLFLDSDKTVLRTSFLNDSISDSRTKVDISVDDAETVLRLAHDSGLDQVSAEDLLRMLQLHKSRYGDDWAVKKEGFQSFLAQLASTSNHVTDEARVAMVDDFGKLFSFFERAKCGNLPLKSLFAALVLFVQGRKSDKFRVVFEQFADFKKLALSRGQLHAFLVSFLLSFAGISSLYGNETINGDALADAVVEVAAQILTETRNMRSDRDLISFDELCVWYSDGGFRSLPWLELLDLQKWEHLLRNRKLPENESDDSDVDSQSSDSDEVVFRFLLNSRKDLLEFSESDCDVLKAFLRISGLNSRSIVSVYSLIKEAGDANGFTSQQAFFQVVRKLIPGENLSEEEKRKMSVLLSGIFSSFDRERSKQVPVREFATGLSVLLAGSKSDKLAYAFDKFDEDQIGSIDREACTTLLACFLTVLFALSDKFCEQEASVLWEIVDFTSVEMGKKIFTDLKKGDGDLSFEELADWYTEGGHDAVPWLELISMPKWPF